jgi:hypothetical protein
MLPVWGLVFSRATKYRANRCEESNPADLRVARPERFELPTLNLRYFDPTLSAAEGHEDKGLIECLMVKCAKAVVYCARERESLRQRC